jgi:beta-lactamase regulating signal transducer with metallopeptidase domain
MEADLIERLAEITVYSAIIFAAVLLFRLLLKKWLSPALKYALWFLVILRLIVPVTLESGFHFITIPADEKPVAAAQSGMIEPAVIPTSVPEAAPRAEGNDTAGEQTIVPAEKAEPLQTARRLNWRQWVVLGWAVGAGTVLIGYAVLSIQLARRIRRNGCEPGEKAQEQYWQVVESMHIRAAIPVYLMPDIKSPALTAQVRPKLLLPDCLLYQADRGDMAFAMAHELMHYKRRDYLVCLLVALLRAVYWFNPVLWIMPRLLRLDMESACDAQVVRGMDKRQKLKYIDLLLTLGQEEANEFYVTEGE